MRQMIGWGAEENTYPLPDSADAYLAGSVREGLRRECGLLILRGACSIRMGA